MRRSPIQDGCDDPASWFRTRGDLHRPDRLGYREPIGRCLNAYLVEPDDTPFSVRELGAIVIVKNLGTIVVVWFEVSMDHGLRMMRIRLVDVFGRDGRRHHEPRRESEREARAPDRMHVAVMSSHKPGSAVKHLMLIEACRERF